MDKNIFLKQFPPEGQFDSLMGVFSPAPSVANEAHFRCLSLLHTLKQNPCFSSIKMLLSLLVVGRARNLQNFPILQLNIFVIKRRRELVSHTLFFVRLFMCNSDHLVVKLQCLSTANNRAFRTLFLYSLLPLHYPGGLLTNVQYGQALPRGPTPSAFICTIIDRERDPFRVPSLYKMVPQSHSYYSKSSAYTMKLCNELK